jgi:hypothetical protein
MNGQQFNFSDYERARLRAIVATIDREMSRLPRSATTEGTDGLIGSWAELVKLLALGPAPEVRECPVCHHIGMLTATLCGYCWTKLSPPSSAVHGGHASP